MASNGGRGGAAALLKSELQRRKVSYRELASLLTRMGVPHTEREVTDRIEGGDFTAAFFAQCCEAIGAPAIHLDY